MDQEYINKITLEYLLNPTINIRNSDNDKTLEKDIKFYRKRICQITKDMTRGQFENETLKSLFDNYVSQIIYYFKRVDAKDIYQEEYNDLTFDDNNLEDHVINDDTSFDKLLLNTQEPIPTLNNFVKKINIEKEQKIVPTQKIANIKDPSLRTKGVKKK